MALTFSQASDQTDAWGALKHGQLITDFTYLMQERPEIYKDMVYGYGDPMVAQIMLEAGIGMGATSSDENRWYEAGRIQDSYSRSVLMTTVPTAGASATLTFPNAENFDIRQDQTILVGALASDITGASDLLEQFFVVSVDTVAKTAVVQSYSGTNSGFIAANIATDEVLTVTHLASDYKQGSSIADESVTHEGVWRSNNPIIIRDYQKYDRSKLKQAVSFSDDFTRYTVDTKAMDKRMQIQKVLACIFGVKADAGTLKTSGINGSESLVSAIQDRGNTVTGSWSGVDDIDSYITVLNSVKGSNKNVLMQDLASTFAFSKSLGSASPHGDANTYDYGAFGEDVDYRRLGFSGVNREGWDILYKHWELLDDATYFGAHEGNSNKVKGISIPKGGVETFSSGTIPHLSIKSRDGMGDLVSQNGAYFGIGHDDVASISKTYEAVLCGASIKDFVLMQG